MVECMERLGNIAARIACRLTARREEIQEKAGDARVERDAAGSTPAREETDAMTAGGKVGPTAGEKCRRPAALVISGRKSPRGLVEFGIVPAPRWHAAVASLGPHARCNRRPLVR